MPTLFEQTFGGGEESEEEERTSVSAVTEDQGLDEEFRLANLKMKKAQFYRVIVDNGVVEDNGTSEAAEVNAEAKQWARRSMLRLLKGENPNDPPPVAKVELPFSLDEVDALKKLVKKALAMGMVEKTSDPPAVRKVQSQPAAPTVRKVKTDGGSKPPQAAPAQATPIPPQPQPKPKGEKKPLKPKPGADGTIDYEEIPSGEVFKDTDGRFYKMVDNPRFDPDIKGSKPRTKISVTTQVKTPRSLPMPQGAQLSAVTAAQSMEAVNMGASVSSQVDPNSDGDQATFIRAAAGALREG